MNPYSFLISKKHMVADFAKFCNQLAKGDFSHKKLCFHVNFKSPIFNKASDFISGTLQQLGSHLSSPSPILFFNNHYLIILFKYFLFSYFMTVYNKQFLHNHFCLINISTLSLIFPQFCLQGLQKSFLHFHCKRGAAT